jgi:hypothetical protein
LCTMLQGKKQSQRYIFEHGKHSYRKFKQNTRSMQKGNRGAKVKNSSIAWRSTSRTSETTVEHQQTEGAQLARAKQSVFSVFETAVQDMKPVTIPFASHALYLVSK